MSEGMNRWTGLGNLAADPELRISQGGQAVLKLRLACNESYLDRNNARQERVEYVSVTVFGKRGEGLAKILDKGSRIMVEGRLSTSSYEKDGEKRYRTEIVATNVLLCGGGRRKAGASQGDNDDDEPAPHRGGGGAAQSHVPDPDPNNGAKIDEIPFIKNETISGRWDRP